VYTVDVRAMGDENGVVRADLYLDGRHSASSRVPAAFPVDGGVIEVAATVFGLRRCHYVTPDGGEQQLVPDPRSAAGRRVRLEHDHPALSRSIGSASVVLLVLGLGVVVLEFVDVVGRIPPVVDRYGGFAAPVQLPLWLTVALGLGAVVASVERGLRLRYHWLLDGAAS
jgi:catechol 2,3-dioxygenase-like lactoylglutathione lyase family enzyme